MSVPPRDERHTGRSGDLDAPDIVGPTGEEMPHAAHDQVATTTPLEEVGAEDRNGEAADKAASARSLSRRRRTSGIS